MWEQTTLPLHHPKRVATPHILSPLVPQGTLDKLIQLRNKDIIPKFNNHINSLLRRTLNYNQAPSGRKLSLINPQVTTYASGACSGKENRIELEKL